MHLIPSRSGAANFEGEIELLERLPFHNNICRYLFHDKRNNKLRLFMTKCVHAHPLDLRILFTIAGRVTRSHGVVLLMWRRVHMGAIQIVT